MGIIFDPVSLHKCVYGRNNPANFRDPTGEFSTGFYVALGLGLLLLLIAMPSLVKVPLALVSAGAFKGAFTSPNNTKDFQDFYRLREIPAALREYREIRRLFNEWFDLYEHRMRFGFYGGAIGGAICSDREWSCGDHARSLLAYIRYNSEITNFEHFRFRVYNEGFTPIPTHTFLVAESPQNSVFLNFDSWMYGRMAPGHRVSNFGTTDVTDQITATLDVSDIENP